MSRAGSLVLGLVLVFSLCAGTAHAGGWENVGVDDGVKIAKKAVDGADVLAFRGITTADVTMAQLMSVFLDEHQRKHWVDRYESHKTLAKTENSQTYWIHFGLPPLVSDRDYVLKSTIAADPDKKTVRVNIKSVKHAKAPVNDCCVRAEVYGTYYLFEALPGGKTKMTVEVHTDPKGLLPSWIVDIIQETWPSKTLNALIARVKKSNTDHPKFAGWN